MDNLKQKLITETAKIKWHELQRFFAQGNVLTVAVEEDLVAVAAGFAADDAKTVARLMESGAISAASDAQAKEWFEQNATVWSVVVAPFVLVQAIQSKNGEVSS